MNFVKALNEAKISLIFKAYQLKGKSVLTDANTGKIQNDDGSLMSSEDLANYDWLDKTGEFGKYIRQRVEQQSRLSADTKELKQQTNIENREKMKGGIIATDRYYKNK